MSLEAPIRETYHLSGPQGHYRTMCGFTGGVVALRADIHHAPGELGVASFLPVDSG